MRRRFDLDWVRVTLFFLLVPYHAAVGFTSYGQFVFGVANDTQGGAGLERALLFINTFRLHALFLVSGAGAWVMLHRIGPLSFVAARALRLLVPLVLAGLSLNMLSQWWTSDQPLVGFARNWVMAPELGHLLHLWFIVNLMLYALMLLPLHLLMQTGFGIWFRERVSAIWRFGFGFGLLILTPLPLVAVTLAWKPHEIATGGEGHRFVVYFGFFLLGYFVMDRERFWKELDRRLSLVVFLAVVASGLVLGSVILASQMSEDFAALLDVGGWAAFIPSPYNGLFVTYMVMSVCLGWWMSLAFLGVAARFLTAPSKLITRLNSSVYAIYIVHFFLIVVALSFVAKLPQSWQFEWLAVTIWTLVGSWVIFWLADLTAVTRVLFGIKRRTDDKRH